MYVSRERLIAEIGTCIEVELKMMHEAMAEN